MAMSGLVIPARLASTVVSWEGERGRAWLEALPALVAEVAARWDLAVGAPFEPGGNISWVAPVRVRSHRVDAVLKLQHPHPESDPEALGLAAWAGVGAVELFAHDPEHHALLIERCEPGGALLDRDGALDAVHAAAAVGAQLHAALPPAGLSTLAVRLAAWADELETRLAARAFVDPGLESQALATMRERPAACPVPVLLHGDLNPTNVLAAQRAPWLAIDPKPMVGDPAYDGPRLVLQPPPVDTATLMARLDTVADAMGVDREALVDWCLVDAIEIGSAARHHDDDATATANAHVVDLLAPLVA